MKIIYNITIYIVIYLNFIGDKISKNIKRKINDIQMQKKIVNKSKNIKNEAYLSNRAYFGETEYDLPLHEKEVLFLNNLENSNLLESNLNETLVSSIIQPKIINKSKGKKINKASKVNETKNFNDNFIYYGSKKYESKSRRKNNDNEKNTGVIKKDEQLVHMINNENYNEQKLIELTPKFTNAYLNNYVQDELDVEIKKKPEFLENIDSISKIQFGIQTNNKKDSKQYFLKNR